MLMLNIKKPKELEFLKPIDYYSVWDSRSQFAQFNFSNSHYANVSRIEKTFAIRFYHLITDDNFTREHEDARVRISNNIITVDYYVDGDRLSIHCETEKLAARFASTENTSAENDPEVFKAIMRPLDFLTEPEIAAVRKLILVLVSKVPLIKNVKNPFRGLYIAVAPVGVVTAIGIPFCLLLSIILSVSGLPIAASNTWLVFFALFIIATIFAMIYGKVSSNKQLSKFGNYEDYIVKLLNSEEKQPE